MIFKFKVMANTFLEIFPSGIALVTLTTFSGGVINLSHIL